jgi:uncharacterized membrane protein
MSIQDGAEGDAAVNEQPRRPGAFSRRFRIFRSAFAVRLRNYFLAGVLVTAPITITVWLAWNIVLFFDNTVRSLVPARYDPESFLPFTMPGIGLLLFLGGLTLIGFLAAGFLGRIVVRTAEGIVNSMPVVRTIYGALKQIFETVLNQKSIAFRQVVLIEYPRRGIWCLGFVSGRTEGEVQNLTGDEMINVFLPTTPNPTSGFLLFFPRKDVIVLNMTVEEGIKMVISGGIVTPPDRRPPEKRNQSVVGGARETLERTVRDEEAAAVRRGVTPPAREVTGG